MNATLTRKSTVRKFEFRLNHNGIVYDVTIHTNGGGGKFIDDQISLNGEELEHEGEEGEMREQIIAFLDAKWEFLIR